MDSNAVNTRDCAWTTRSLLTLLHFLSSSLSFFFFFLVSFFFFFLLLLRCSEGVDFRTGDAYAKKGKERYCYWNDLKKMFVKKIEVDAKDNETHIVLKALRLYLDIAYF